MRGSKQFGLPAGAGIGTVQGTLPDLGPPYTYMFSASLGIDPLHPASMNVQLYSCVAPDEEFEGTSHAVVVNGFAPLQTGPTLLTSPDGLVYENGIVNNQPPYLTAGYDWSLRGET
jgi:hypothetical protein